MSGTNGNNGGNGAFTEENTLLLIFKSLNGEIKNALTLKKGSIEIDEQKNAIFAKNLQFKSDGVLEASLTAQSTLTLEGEKNTLTSLIRRKQNNEAMMQTAYVDLIGRSTRETATHTEHFRILEIGSKNGNGGGAGVGAGGTSTSAGLAGNFTFKLFIDPKAEQGSDKSEIAGDKANNDKTYGHAYSDRLLIFKAKENNPQSLHLTYHADTLLDTIKYTSGKGTETVGNIALVTLNEQANNLTTISVPQSVIGFDQVTTELIATKTDENGKVNGAGGGGGGGSNDYTTLFIKEVRNDGATKANQHLSAAALGSNSDLYLANFNSLNKRMGELRDNPKNQGTWFRIFNGYQSNAFASNTNFYTTLQGGYNYGVPLDGSHQYRGLALSYAISNIKSETQSDLDGSKKGIEALTSHSAEFALYNVYVEDEGWYNDTIAKLSYLFSNFKLSASSYSTQNMAFTLSNEIGYRFKLGNSKAWFIDPQFELSAGYLNQSDFSQTLEKAGLSAASNGVGILRSRLGVSSGYDFKDFTQGDFNASLYLGAFYEYDYVQGGEIGIITSSSSFANSKAITLKGNIGSDQRMLLNVGTNLKIKDHTRVYVDIQSSFFGKITTHYQINLGARYSFGESTPTTPRVNPITNRAMGTTGATNNRGTTNPVGNPTGATNRAVGNTN